LPLGTIFSIIAAGNNPPRRNDHGPHLARQRLVSENLGHLIDPTCKDGPPFRRLAQINYHNGLRELRTGISRSTAQFTISMSCSPMTR